LRLEAQGSTIIKANEGMKASTTAVSGHGFTKTVAGKLYALAKRPGPSSATWDVEQVESQAAFRIPRLRYDRVEIENVYFQVAGSCRRRYLALIFNQR
jgi:hypothetical protein